jgi:uncharacterized protein
VNGDKFRFVIQSNINNRLERMSQIRCSICGKAFDSESGEYMPFCSERCKRIDLGRWLDERYGLPYEPPEENAEFPQEES